MKEKQEKDMELLIIVLNREEYFEKVVSILVESGVSGATLYESEGLGHFLAYEVPIFAGLRKFIGEGKSRNRTIIAVLHDKETFPRFEKLLAEEHIDFTVPGTGIIVTVPVNKVIGPENNVE
jgi:nitrogen regulatory protein P-II 1